MATKEAQRNAHREYTQLLRLSERVMLQLEKVASDLDAPDTSQLAREVRRRTGDSEQSLSEVTSAVQQAIRTVKVWESELRLALQADPNAVEVDGVTNLPATLARFLAERAQMPGFRYDVIQDEVRGWVIRWKEMTPQGTVRGCGQFYERPYAWIDE